MTKKEAENIKSAILMSNNTLHGFVALFIEDFLNFIDTFVEEE